MLYNNHICKVQTQHFKQMEVNYFKNGTTSGDILLPLRTALSTNNALCESFANEAYKLFSTHKVCNEQLYYTNYEQLAIYGVLFSGVIFAYSYKTGDFSMYTSSITVIESLANMGVLKSKKDGLSIELEKLRKILGVSERVRKSLKDGNKFVTCRLDSIVEGNSARLTATIPKTAISLETHAFVHFNTLKCAWEIIRNEVQDKILKIKMGDKERYVTLNRSLLSSIYGEERAIKLCSYTPDIYSLRFYLPSVGESKYAPGVTNIKVENIDSISIAGLADIDLSNVNKNYSTAKPYFIGALKRMKEKNLGKVAQDLGLDCLNADINDLRERTIEQAGIMYSKDIDEFIRKHPNIFNISKYESAKPVYGDSIKSVNLPINKMQLQQLVDNNVCKIVITKRNGKFSTEICTNSKDLLSKALGASYFGEYESEGVRLKYLKKLLESGEDAQKACKFCNIEYTGGKDYMLNYCNAQLGNVEERKTVVKQAHTLTVRNLDATSTSNFYKMIDPKSIVELSVLS